MSLRVPTQELFVPETDVLLPWYAPAGLSRVEKVRSIGTGESFHLSDAKYSAFLDSVGRAALALRVPERYLSPHQVGEVIR